jgi:ABC-type bacteriocin/lantibiotic exporter with double-glycine peptidase domain
MSREPVRPTRRHERTVSSAVAVYIIVLLALQIFLLTVALDALLAYDPAMAWVSAGFSVLLAISSALFYRYVRR